MAIACTNGVIDFEIDVSSLFQGVQPFLIHETRLIQFSDLIRTILRQQHDIFILFTPNEAKLKQQKQKKPINIRSFEKATNIWKESLIQLDFSQKRMVIHMYKKNKENVS